MIVLCVLNILCVYVSAAVSKLLLHLLIYSFFFFFVIVIHIQKLTLQVGPDIWKTN